MIGYLFLLLNLTVFLLVNCADDPPPRPRPRPRPPPPVIVHTTTTKRREKSEKSKKQKRIKQTDSNIPKSTEPKMKARERNDNETVDETPSQWGDVDAAFKGKSSRGKKR